MKHIKPYQNTQAKNEDLENLEDYLQEFFDKYHIVKYTDGKEFESYTCPFYRIKNISTILIDIGEGNAFELSEKFESITIELEEIKSSIEKRLNKEIWLKYKKRNPWQGISIII